MYLSSEGVPNLPTHGFPSNFACYSTRSSSHKDSLGFRTKTFGPQDVPQIYIYTCLKTLQYKINSSTWLLIMSIVVVKEVLKKYFTVLKRFVYISVIPYISNIENQELIIF